MKIKEKVYSLNGGNIYLDSSLKVLGYELSGKFPLCRSFGIWNNQEPNAEEKTLINELWEVWKKENHEDALLYAVMNDKVSNEFEFVWLNLHHPECYGLRVLQLCESYKDYVGEVISENLMAVKGPAGIVYHRIGGLE